MERSYGNTYRFALKEQPELARLIKSAFPGYKKREATIAPFTSANINSYWDGGSRSEYVLIDVATGRRLALPTSSHPYFDVARYGAEGENSILKIDHVGNMTLLAVPPNAVLIEAGTFCGKPATARIMAHADLFPKYLTA